MGYWRFGTIWNLPEEKNTYIVPSYASDLYALEIDPYHNLLVAQDFKDKNGKLIFEMILLSGRYRRLGFQKMRRESVSCGMKTDGVRMSCCCDDYEELDDLIQRILK